MYKNKIFWQLFASSLLIILIFLLLLTVYSSRLFAHLNVEQPVVFIEIFLLSLVIAAIAGSINYFISCRIGLPYEKLILRQKQELDIVLSNMKEGLLFIDSGKKITKLNPAAVSMFNIDEKFAYGNIADKTITNSSLCAFIYRALESHSSLQTEIIMDVPAKSHILAYSIPVYNENKVRNGVLIVTHDITNIKKLENIRQDFVSNVSHELKTPITSIQGFVETLLDDELDDPEEIRNFLGIIKKHTGRLKAIIEDLLSLSRLEQDLSRSEISFIPASINDVLKTAVQTCELKAKSRSISLNLICDEDIQAVINPLLIEQAVINLIDNAIKYSDDNCTVSVSASREQGGNIIKVEDDGCGIPEEHLGRIFERFYRVDKARSRRLGGTGLGLAIVKHIIQLHNGYVRVESKPQKGSSFYIHLPES